MKSEFEITKNKLVNQTFITIRAFLEHCGWKDFDPEMRTNNMLFVIDPLTGQNYPIDYAYIVQTTRDLYDIQLKNK